MQILYCANKYKKCPHHRVRAFLGGECEIRLHFRIMRK